MWSWAFKMSLKKLFYLSVIYWNSVLFPRYSLNSISLASSANYSWPITYTWLQSDWLQSIPRNVMCPRSLPRHIFAFANYRLPKFNPLFILFTRPLTAHVAFLVHTKKILGLAGKLKCISEWHGVKIARIMSINIKIFMSPNELNYKDQQIIQRWRKNRHLEREGQSQSILTKNHR